MCGTKGNSNVSLDSSCDPYLHLLTSYDICKMIAGDPGIILHLDTTEPRSSKPQLTQVVLNLAATFFQIGLARLFPVVLGSPALELLGCWHGQGT